MLGTLKNLQIDRIDIDEAIALFGFGKTLSTLYGEFSLPVPEWLDDRLGALKKEIVERRRDYLENRLKEAKARRSALRTAEEKRADVDNEIAELTKALG